MSVHPGTHAALRLRRLAWFDREIRQMERKASDCAARTLVVPIELLQRLRALRADRKKLVEELR